MNCFLPIFSQKVPKSLIFQQTKIGQNVCSCWQQTYFSFIFRIAADLWFVLPRATRILLRPVAQKFRRHSLSLQETTYQPIEAEIFLVEQFLSCIKPIDDDRFFIWSLSKAAYWPIEAEKIFLKLHNIPLSLKFFFGRTIFWICISTHWGLKTIFFSQIISKLHNSPLTTTGFFSRTLSKAAY